MTIRKLPMILAITALGAFGAGYARQAAAEAPKPADKPGAAGGAAAGAAPTNCKVYGGGKCCDPAVTAHLPKESIFKDCGESEATFLGESGKKDECRYYFKVEGEKPDDSTIMVYAPQQKEVPSSPTDPFFSYKHVGKVYITDKAKSPKVAATMAKSTGLWLPGKGYFVSVNASTSVCSKPEASKLAPFIK
jgi:hypothetical protein